jgi:excinuclease ABC subunit B
VVAFFLFVRYWKPDRISKKSNSNWERPDYFSYQITSIVQSLYSRTEADFKEVLDQKETLLMCILVMQMKPTVFIFCDELRRSKALTPRISSPWKIWKITIYPANMFVTSPDVLQNAIWEINKI